jgi:hypothetical protein
VVGHALKDILERVTNRSHALKDILYCGWSCAQGYFVVRLVTRSRIFCTAVGHALKDILYCGWSRAQGYFVLRLVKRSRICCTAVGHALKDIFERVTNHLKNREVTCDF